MYEEDVARQALAAGAHGYVMKGQMIEELQQAIAAMTSGGVWVSASLGRSIVKDYVGGGWLSDGRRLQRHDKRGALAGRTGGRDRPAHRIRQALRDVEAQPRRALARGRPRPQPRELPEQPRTIPSESARVGHWPVRLHHAHAPARRATRT